MIRLVQEVPAKQMNHGYHKCFGCNKSISLGQSFYEVKVDITTPAMETKEIIIPAETKSVSRYYHEDCIWAFEKPVETVKSNTCPKCFMVGRCFCEVK